jgi:23S rRNA (adenine2503-C2)-methyltransferase
MARTVAFDHPVERLPDEWSEVLLRARQPKFRGQQVFEWIHGHGVLDPDRMTNLPKSLRAQLSADGLGPALEIAQAFPSDDGTRKLLVRLPDGKDV